MDLITHIRRLFDHMYWADRRVLERLGESPGQMERSIGLLAHLLAAEQVWLARIEGDDGPDLQIWPPLSLSDCAAVGRTNRFRYSQYLHHLTEAELSRVAAYRNSQGVGHRTPVRDILTHVAMHGSYHRGQIAALLRAGGGQPVNTDYITFVREPGDDTEPLLPA